MLGVTLDRAVNSRGVASSVRVGRNGENGRAGEIRTHDLLHPMQARYQATLQPEQVKGQKTAPGSEKQAVFSGW